MGPQALRETLYVSDLDGTLLGEDATLSPITIEAVNRFIKAGGLFTVATGRSQRMAAGVLEGLQLQLPVILNNGAATYDFQAGTYDMVYELGPADVAFLQGLSRKYRMTAFLFTLGDDVLRLYYETLYRERDHAYVETRWKRYDGQIIPCDSLTALAGRTPFFCVFHGKKGELLALRQEIEGRSGSLGCEMFWDVYQKDIFFMDVFSAKASKAAAMEVVRERFGASHAVAFGDNFNDMSMLRSASRAYVTANGIPEAKAVATEVIGSNREDGVARFLLSELEKVG